MKALIVDDIDENLYLLESLMTGNGYKVITANNGAEALGLALKDPPDIIITDILMPVMDGYTLCRSWKKDERLKNIPFVFYTATYTHPKDEEFALSLGADMFLIKPQEPDEFIAKIKKILNDFDENKLQTHDPDELPEIVVYKEYNETLIRKMEDRMLQSEEAEKKIRNYATQLENEIEQRKVANQALKESEEKYRSIFENTSVAILLTEPSGNILSANSFACKLFGMTEEEICKAGREGLIDVSSPNLTSLLEERRRTGQAKGELTFIKSDGSRFQAEVSSVIFLDKEGRERTSMVIRDLTEQKQAEEALKESQQLYKNLTQISPVGIFRTNLDGNITYVNPRWSELTGLSFEDAKDQSWINAVHPDDRQSLIENWNENVKMQQSSFAEYRFLKPDGSIVWVVRNAVPEVIDSTVKGFIGTITDITELKLVEKQLLIAKEKAEESDRLKTAFLHNVSHEIRTPMNAIIGFSGFLNNPDLSFEKRNFFTDIIVQSCNQLLLIISDIISIATIEAGQVKIQEEKVNLNSILNLLYKQFIPKAREKHIFMSLKADLPDNEADITTDGTKLNEILSNLIGNALKFTKEGFVNFGYNVKESFLEFYIEDSGIGIPLEMHEEIFKRFRQIEIKDAQFGGSGLGLSISKAHVELLGGKIWLTSEPEKGTVFYFTIPYKKTNINALTEKLYASDNPIEIEKPRTLLVAEDEDYNFMLIKEILSDANFTIIRAINGVEAVEICKSNPDIHLVIMDIKMPLMDGYEATKQIKELRPNLIVIAQTAYSTDIDKNKAIACGCSDFISKPFKEEQLLSKVKEQLIKEPFL